MAAKWSGYSKDSAVLPGPFAPGMWPDAELAGDRAVVRAMDGGEAAAAWSVRESAHAAECAVETREPYRRRGLARQVTAAWADHVLARGRVPFFSHLIENVASRGLATSLGAVPVFEVVTLESTREIDANCGNPLSPIR